MFRQSAHDGAYSWLRLAITLAIAMVGNVGMWAIIVILPAIQAEFGVDRAAASVPYTLTMVGFALGNFLIGRAVDRFGMARCLAVAGAGLALGFGLATLSGGVVALSVVQLGVGFFTAASFGPLIADVSRWFSRRRGIAVAVAASGNYLSGALWPAVLSGVLAGDGWRTAYLVLAAACLLIMVPLSALLARPVPEAMVRHDAVTSAARLRTMGFSPGTLQRLLAVAGVGCCVAMSMPQVHIVALSVDLGFGATAGARMLSLMLLGGVVSRLVSGLIADRLGGVAALLIGSVLQCLALVLFLPASGLAALYAVSLVFGLAQGGIVPSYAVIVREYMPPEQAGARVGVVIMATIVGMALGGWLSGWIYDVTGGYTMALVNGIGWNLMNIAIIGLILFSARRGGRMLAA